MGEGQAFRNFETMIADKENILVNNNVDISDLQVEKATDEEE